MPDIWEFAATAAKFALYLSVLIAAGSVFASRIFRLDMIRDVSLKFGILGLFAAAFTFTLRGAALTGDAAGMIDPEILHLLWTTPVGSALVYRIAGLGLLIFGLFLGRAGQWISISGSLLAIWSFVRVGHVPDRDVPLMNIALGLHLTAVSLWIGILTPLKRLLSEEATWPRAALVGHQFGVVASITVPLLIVAGVFLGYQLVASLSALGNTGYGRALILKVILVTGLLAFAAANKLRFIPNLKAGHATAAAHLKKSISFEWFVILAVLATTAVLTSSLPLPE